MVYVGDATVVGGDIEFKSRVGQATYAERVHLWDSETTNLSDFTTMFSFSISNSGASSYGHGLAFFLAPVGFQIPPNSGGGFLGLYNTTTILTANKTASSFSAWSQIVHVEFDSFSNEEWDPPFEHVGINNNSIASATFVPWNLSLHSEDTAIVRIAYDSTSKNLSVSWSYAKTSSPLEESSLSYQIDLRQVLPEWVTVGFSASTGANVERHTLQSWEFNSSLNMEANGKNPKRTRLEWHQAVGIAVSAAVLIFGAVMSFHIYQKRKRNRKETEETMSLIFTEEKMSLTIHRKFSYKDLVKATNNFSDDRKLGEGGFGSVYRGYLTEMDVPVAVKKISKWSKQGKKEYTTEVKIISRLRHRNLVQLIGWCHEKGVFLLIYEFMPNGSLDLHLFGKKSSLTWAVRYKIALGLASALLYLHEGWERCVVHRDIKSSNVMLDANFNVKLSDFGLARLMDHELGPKTTGLAGTIGYLAPEYISTGRASKESDVYSFGVVCLEVATGRKSVDPKKFHEGLLQWAWDLYGKEMVVSAVDERLHKDFEEKQLVCLMVVGLWCAHPEHSMRPSIRQAIQVLNFEAEMPNLPQKMPFPMYHLPPPSVSSGDPSITATSLEIGR